MARAIALRKANRLQVGDLVDIDSCLEETHTMSSQVTDHPVEVGANISDHSRPEPDRVRLRCFVSNTPLSEDQVSSAVRSGSVTWETTQPETVEGRGENALKKLTKMRDDGALIAVVTSLKTYPLKETEGMLIEQIEIPVTRENYDGLEFSLSLKRVTLVRTQTALVKKPKDKRAGGKQTKGKVATEEKKKRVSLAKKLASAVR